MQQLTIIPDADDQKICAIVRLYDGWGYMPDAGNDGIRWVDRSAWDFFVSTSQYWDNPWDGNKYMLWFTLENTAHDCEDRLADDESSGDAAVIGADYDYYYSVGDTVYHRYCYNTYKSSLQEYYNSINRWMPHNYNYNMLMSEHKLPILNKQIHMSRMYFALCVVNNDHPCKISSPLIGDNVVLNSWEEDSWLIPHYFAFATRDTFYRCTDYGQETIIQPHKILTVVSLLNKADILVQEGDVDSAIDTRGALDKMMNAYDTNLGDIHNRVYRTNLGALIKYLKCGYIFDNFLLRHYEGSEIITPEEHGVIDKLVKYAPIEINIPMHQPMALYFIMKADERYYDLDFDKFTIGSKATESDEYIVKSIDPQLFRERASGLRLAAAANPAQNYIILDASAPGTVTDGDLGGRGTGELAIGMSITLNGVDGDSNTLVVSDIEGNVVYFDEPIGVKLSKYSEITCATELARAMYIPRSAVNSLINEGDNDRVFSMFEYVEESDGIGKPGTMADPAYNYPLMLTNRGETARMSVFARPKMAYFHVGFVAYYWVIFYSASGIPFHFQDMVWWDAYWVQRLPIDWGYYDSQAANNLIIEDAIRNSLRFNQKVAEAMGYQSPMGHVTIFLYFNPGHYTVSTLPPQVNAITHVLWVEDKREHPMIYIFQNKKDWREEWDPTQSVVASGDIEIGAG